MYENDFIVEYVILFTEYNKYNFLNNRYKWYCKDHSVHC